MNPYKDMMRALVGPPSRIEEVDGEFVHVWDFEKDSAMNNDMLADHIKMIQHITVMVDSGDLDKLVSTLDQVDAIMPIIDPTLYRSRMGAHELNKRCVAAFQAYHKELMRIRHDMEGER